MDYQKPTEVVAAIIEAGASKATLPVRDLLIRGALSGAILGIATSLAITTTLQTSMPIMGALVFPVGFVMIVLLGLELVTGSFALLPLAQMSGCTGWGGTFRNWGWVFCGNLLGSLGYAVLLWATLTMSGDMPAGGIAAKIIDITEVKTLGYAAHGMAGLTTAFIKGVLCNWMVCMGVVMGMVARSTASKIIAAWLPIFIFFAHGFEHAVVNMFVIPAGIMLGAKTTVLDWWLWNEIPVTLGNLVGGFLFTGLALYLTYGKRAPQREPAKLIESPRLGELNSGAMT
jgi:formate/nitrite transporter